MSAAEHFSSAPPAPEANAAEGFFKLIMSGKAAELFVDDSRDQVDKALRYSTPGRQQPQSIYRTEAQHQEMVDWERAPLVAG